MSPSNNDFILAVEGLTVSFDGFKAVNDLSLYLEPKEIRVIIGPNGAGKTTVFNCISGIYRPDQGSIRFAGQELLQARLLTTGTQRG